MSLHDCDTAFDSVNQLQNSQITSALCCIAPIGIFQNLSDMLLILTTAHGNDLGMHWN